MIKPPRHYALAKSSAPPRRRIRPPFAPSLIDATKFYVDRVRPYPEWPLICKEANRGAFDSEKDLRAYLAKHCPAMSIYKTWECKSCLKFHAECYPLEVSGQSSGKSTRKDDFKSNHHV